MGSRSGRRVRVERGIYIQPNGKYAVCWRQAGRLRFRTVGFELAEARRERLALIATTRDGTVPVSPRLCFETVAGWWLERFEAKVAAGERHLRTLEAHRYQLDRHLLPALARRRIAALTVDDVAGLLDALRRKGCSAKTSASALATLQSVMRFARRCGWIVADPVELLEHDERPRPQRRRQRVLARAEIERLLGACAPRDRLMVATVLYTGLRISELLGLVWDDVDFAAGVIHVRAQLSRAHRGAPAQRVAPKTPASGRDVPLVAQLAPAQRTQAAQLIRARRRLGVRDRARHSLRPPQRQPARARARRAARRAERRRLAAASLPRPAPHLRQPPDHRPRARPSPGQPHPRPSAHHHHARHLHPSVRGRPPRQDIRTRMAASPFARLLEPTTAQPGATVLKLP